MILLDLKKIGPLFIYIYWQQIFFYADFIKLKMQLGTAQLLLFSL